MNRKIGLVDSSCRIMKYLMLWMTKSRILLMYESQYEFEKVIDHEDHGLLYKITKKYNVLLEKYTIYFMKNVFIHYFLCTIVITFSPKHIFLIKRKINR